MNTSIKLLFTAALLALAPFTGAQSWPALSMPDVPLSPRPDSDPLLTPSWMGVRMPGRSRLEAKPVAAAAPGVFDFAEGKLKVQRHSAGCYALEQELASHWRLG